MEEMNSVYTLPKPFSRQSRDRIVQLALGIKFERSSRVNGGRVWLHDLLRAMTDEGMFSESWLEMLREEIPLPDRRLEV
jgi:hypothetical protein